MITCVCVYGLVCPDPGPPLDVSKTLCQTSKQPFQLSNKIHNPDLSNSYVFGSQITRVCLTHLNSSQAICTPAHTPVLNYRLRQF